MNTESLVTYRGSCHCGVVRFEVEAQAEAILASIETALRGDNTVGSAVMYAELDSFESIPDSDSDGLTCMIEAVITCQANL